MDKNTPPDFMIYKAHSAQYKPMLWDLYLISMSDVK